MRTEYQIKEAILFRLHDAVGICNVCGQRDCAHTSTRLPVVMDTDEVIKAIDLDGKEGYAHD